jgi:hypothetical protein
MTSGAPAEKATSDLTIMAVVAAVGTGLGAFQLFQPKFAIGMAMRREIGRNDAGFWLFYTLPQWLTVVSVAFVWLILLAAVVHQFVPDFGAGIPLVKWALDLLALKNLIPVLLLAACLAGAIQMNVVAWLFLGVSSFVAMLPIPWVRGAVGMHGRSAGWMQAKNMCLNWDKGQPLLIAQDEVGRFADALLYRMGSVNAPTQDFAQRPGHATAEAAANIAVIGGILEQAHSTNRWPRPSSWASFYRALSDIEDETQIFSPQKLFAYDSGADFWKALRERLIAKMKAMNEAIPDGDYFAASSYVVNAWKILADHAGSALRLIPFGAGLFGGKLFWLDQALRKFPLLHDDGMRPQVIKLMTRWELTPWARKAGFLQPFSKDQAWLLLQEGVLTVLPEQKDITFWAVGDIGIFRAASRQIFARAILSARQGLSSESKAVAAKYKTDWDLAVAADFIFWSWAQQESKKGRADGWAAAKGWRWKIENGRASRTV